MDERAERHGALTGGGRNFPETRRADFNNAEAKAKWKALAPVFTQNSRHRANFVRTINTATGGGRGRGGEGARGKVKAAGKIETQMREGEIRRKENSANECCWRLGSSISLEGRSKTPFLLYLQELFLQVRTQGCWHAGFLENRTFEHERTSTLIVDIMTGEKTTRVILKESNLESYRHLSIFVFHFTHLCNLDEIIFVLLYLHCWMA